MDLVQLLTTYLLDITFMTIINNYNLTLIRHRKVL